MQDLIKLPSFPRKALEADLDLYHNGQMGKVGRQGIAHRVKTLLFRVKAQLAVEEEVDIYTS